MNNVILTGCDKNTEWQLPWFLDNLFKYNPKAKVVIANFGMSNEMLEQMKSHTIINIKEKVDGWFKKPASLLSAISLPDVNKVCWIDTDAQINGDISHIFDYTVPNKLTIAIDYPWTKRRPEMGVWYNTGVIVLEDVPEVLPKWRDQCRFGGEGDQTTLHEMFNGNDILKGKHIQTLPKTFNTLRIDLIDGTAVPNPLIMHWTGRKGKDVIIKQMAND